MRPGCRCGQGAGVTVPDITSRNRSPFRSWRVSPNLGLLGEGRSSYKGPTQDPSVGPRMTRLRIRPIQNPVSTSTKRSLSPKLLEGLQTHETRGGEVDQAPRGILPRQPRPITRFRSPRPLARFPDDDFDQSGKTRPLGSSGPVGDGPGTPRSATAAPGIPPQPPFLTPSPYLAHSSAVASGPRWVLKMPILYPLSFAIPGGKSTVGSETSWMTSPDRPSPDRRPRRDFWSCPERVGYRARR